MLTAWARDWIAVGRLVAMSAAIGTLLCAASSVNAQQQAPRDKTASTLAEASHALAAGDPSRAFVLGTDYLKRHPGDLQAQLLLVEAHIDLEEWDAAYAIASQAVRAHADNVDALYHLGLVTRQLAANQFDRLMQMAPESARVHQLRAEVFDAQERRSDAEREYAAAIAVQPALLEALLGLGRLERIRLACEDAVGHYMKAEAIRPTFDAAFGLGVCHSYLQDEEQALAHFRLAVQRDPTAATAWAGMGTSLVKLRRTAEGIEALLHAISLEPEMSEAHYVLGLAYQASGDTERARASFQKAEELRVR